MSHEAIVDQNNNGVEQQLALWARSLAGEPYSGYPARADRLVMDPADFEYDETGRLVLPDGPWNVDFHPRQPLWELAPTPARQAELQAQGYVLDSRGRPLHPWFARMISNPLIGVTLGKGENWEWGPSQTVDMLAAQEYEGEDHFLLIERDDTGEWAVPGGYKEADETDEEGALREAAEETELVIPSGAEMVQIYQGPVADPRATAHAWNNTTAFYVRLPAGPLPKVTGQSDARTARWVPRSELEKRRMRFFGSHQFLAQLAMEQASSEAA